MVDIIIYLKKMIGIKYKWWREGDIINHNPPFYSENNIPPSIDYIKKNGICCTGLINLVRRYINLEVPGVKENNFPGSTGTWFKYLNTKNILIPLDINKVIPIGSLLIHDFIDVKNQGHVAILIEKNDNLFESKIIHAYEDINKTNTGLPGVVIEKIKKNFYWNDDNTYTHYCLPENWLTKNKF